jgi:hypothetical protein
MPTLPRYGYAGRDRRREHILSLSPQGAANAATLRGAAYLSSLAVADESSDYQSEAGGPSDIDAYKRRRAIEESEKLFTQSPLGHRFIQRTIDFIVGTGFDMYSPDRQATRVLREFWYNPLNAFDQRTYLFVQELLVYGELALPFAVTERGSVQCNLLPSKSILRVEAPEGLPDEVERIIVAEENNKERAFRPIRFNSATGEYEGDCFFYRINRLGGQQRGYPLLLPLIDWINTIENFAFNKLDRDSRLTGSYWKVLLEGYSQADIEAWLHTEQSRPPRPNQVIAHNEKATWDLVSHKPELINEDMDYFIDLLAGAAGLADITTPGRNRASNAPGESIDPALKSLGTRQHEVLMFFRQIGLFVLQEARRQGRVKKRPVDVLVRAPKIGVRDAQRASGAVYRIAEALQTAQTNTWLAPEEAGAIFRETMRALEFVAPQEDSGA